MTFSGWVTASLRLPVENRFAWPSPVNVGETCAEIPGIRFFSADSRLGKLRTALTDKLKILYLANSLTSHRNVRDSELKKETPIDS